MSVSSGFFSSDNHDRKYSAEEIGKMFDGLISDGVYKNYLNAFKVNVSSGMNIIVSGGRAWLDHIWILNDADMSITIPRSETILNRIDAVIIDIDKTADVRRANIFVKSGSPSSSPTKPIMIKDANHIQYPIRYVTVKANTASIDNSNIENVVGTSELPFVNAILSFDDNIVSRIEALEARQNIRVTSEGTTLNIDVI